MPWLSRATATEEKRRSWSVLVDGVTGDCILSRRPQSKSGLGKGVDGLCLNSSRLVNSSNSSQERFESVGVGSGSMIVIDVNGEGAEDAASVADRVIDTRLAFLEVESSTRLCSIECCDFARFDSDDGPSGVEGIGRCRGLFLPT